MPTLWLAEHDLCNEKKKNQHYKLWLQIPCFEKILIKEERLDVDNEVMYQCVACELATSCASILRNHFISSHADLIDEFQVCSTWWWKEMYYIKL
jgi:hypothetical protein